MPEPLPLFPLGTVLFPGMVLPLHVFEPRYRALVQRLLGQPENTTREFGVVGIRQGWEVGADNTRALYDHGCTATVRAVQPLADGGYDLVTVGGQRFRLDEVDAGAQPYLVGQVVRLPDGTGDAAHASVLAASVRDLYAQYLTALATVQDLQMTVPELPSDPIALSHLVAATAPLELGDRHTLLAAENAGSRLRAELRLLKRELTMLLRLRVVPLPLADLAVPRSEN